jgi:hypothetical protein
MFCCSCGAPLTPENRRGLVCAGCRVERSASVRAPNPPLIIRYCFMCGKPCEDDGHNIGHPACVGFVFNVFHGGAYGAGTSATAHSGE